MKKIKDFLDWFDKKSTSFKLIAVFVFLPISFFIFLFFIGLIATIFTGSKNDNSNYETFGERTANVEDTVITTTTEKEVQEIQPKQPTQKSMNEAEVRAYASKMVLLVGAIGKDGTELGNLLENNTIEIFIDTNTQYRALLYIENLKVLGDEVIAINPPAETAKVHANYVAGVKLMKEGLNLMSIGISNTNANYINQSAIKIQEGTKYFKEANREMDIVADKYT